MWLRLIIQYGTIKFKDVINHDDWLKRRKEEQFERGSHENSSRRDAVGDLIRCMKDPLAFTSASLSVRVIDCDAKRAGAGGDGDMKDVTSARVSSSAIGTTSLSQVSNQMAQALLETEKAEGAGAATVVRSAIFQRIVNQYNNEEGRMSHMIQTHIQKEFRAFKKSISHTYAYACACTLTLSLIISVTIG